MAHKATNVLNNNNQSITNFVKSNYLLGDNYFGSAVYTDSGSGSSIVNFLIVGKIAATGKIVPVDISASDGSQFPIGLIWTGLNDPTAVAVSASHTFTYVNKGAVASSLIIYPGVLTADSVIAGDGRTLEDYVLALGLILKGGEELTLTDNQ